MSLSLYRTYLSPAPSGDPRPDPYHPDVLERVIAPGKIALMSWLQYRQPHVAEEQAVAAVAYALKVSCADAFRAATLLMQEFNWPSDASLVLTLHQMTAAIPVAVRYVERLWVVRTGHRFPAQKNDIIEWVDNGGTRGTGEVLSVDTSTATAVVQPRVGTLVRDVKFRIFAENVLQNKTRIVNPPQLGFRIEAEEGPEERVS